MDALLLTLMDHVHDPTQTTEEHLDAAIETARRQAEERQAATSPSEPGQASLAAYQQYQSVATSLKSAWLKTKSIVDLRAWLQLPFPVENVAHK